MRKLFILGLTTIGITLTPYAASAAGDDQYPAANFQPKVIYIDKEAVKLTAVASAATAKSDCSNQSAIEKATEFDPKYPAASFQPKVIYP